MWSDFAFRFRALLNRRAVESELDDELREHFDHLVARYLTRGMSPDEATRAARLDLGGFEQLKEACREARGVSWIENALRDVGFGLRLLRRNVGFAATAIATLALGIGATTAVFAAVNALLFRPLPIPQMNRLVSAIALRENFDPFGNGLVDYAAYRNRAHSFTSIGLSRQSVVNLIENGEAEALPAAFIDEAYLNTLEVPPVLGRNFTAGECNAGGARVALIGYGLWQRKFAHDPQVLGSSLNLDGTAFTIVGVMPSFFDLPQSTAVWLPLHLDAEGLPLAARANHDYEITGRLKPGVTLAQANLDVKAVSREVEQEIPQFRRNWGVKLLTLRDALLGDVDSRSRRAMSLLFGAVGLLFLICCVNVTSLLLARGVTREQEIAMRSALGASTARIVSQLVTEGGVLASFGGVAGLVFAFCIVPVFASLNPIQTFALSGLLSSFRVDTYSLCFVALLTVVVVMLCPLLPAIKSAKSRQIASLVNQGPQRGNRSGGSRWLAVLIVAEIAIAVPLLVAGTLFYRSFRSLERVDLGYRPDHVLTLHLELAAQRYGDFSKRQQFVRDVLEKVHELPGVVSAGFTNNLPLSNNSRDSAFTVEGHPVSDPSSLPITSHRLVSPEYLQTLGVQLLTGRLLNEQDRAGSMPVAVISEEFARQGWGGEDPIGQRVRRGTALDSDYPWLTVVGIVRNVKEDRDNFRINRPVWYLPYDQQPNTYPLNLAVRSATNPADLSDEIRKAIHTVDPLQGITDVSDMQSEVAAVMSTDQFAAFLLGSLAAMGLVLSAIGLYGVMAYMTRRRTREIGIRMALGATPRQLLMDVVAKGALLAGVGLGIGLFGSIAATNLLANLLYGVRASSPPVLISVTFVLASTALLACAIPAWKATRVDPIITLR